MRSLRERLSNSERAVDALKSNMSSMVTQRDQVHSELHQARLQAAQLTLQLADCSLALREGRARWAQERQAMQRDTEVNSCSAAPHRTELTLAGSGVVELEELTLHAMCWSVSSTEGPGAAGEARRRHAEGGGGAAGGEDGESEAGGGAREGEGLQQGEEDRTPRHTVTG